MKYLLLGGAPNTGKTGSLNRLAATLITTKGFRNVANWNYPPTVTNGDFRLILEGLDNNKNLIRIYINSASDTKKIIQDCKKFYDDNQPVDIIISSIRDIFSARTEFFNIMKVDNSIDYIMELPLAKVRRGNHRGLCLKWYEEKIDKLAVHTLENDPYNL
ncbi:hypothetical protein [Flavobacterium difficile]|uniref:G domain-containing protein n=1 Tax=Flavobacterium difficile TaxID=2709659 RepID=A0ABX0I7P4_9FLAO|nr:hypothetical protein [Flavobacterium difficile]NHM01471.1 hypothetical protein [Flavobacterium difficile]